MLETTNKLFEKAAPVEKKLSRHPFTVESSERYRAGVQIKHRMFLWEFYNLRKIVTSRFIPWTCSSVGQSGRLIIWRSGDHDPPGPHKMVETIYTITVGGEVRVTLGEIERQHLSESVCDSRDTLYWRQVFPEIDSPIFILWQRSLG